MRTVDTTSLTESEKFWVHVGTLSVKSMLTGQPLSDFVIEDKPEVIEAAMAKPQNVRDKLFRAAVRVTLQKTLEADARRLLKEPDSTSLAYNALVKYLDYLRRDDPKFTIYARAAQPKKALRKIVQHDKQGRIKSFLEVEESVVI